MRLLMVDGTVFRIYAIKPIQGGRQKTPIHNAWAQVQTSQMYFIRAIWQGPHVSRVVSWLDYCIPRVCHVLSSTLLPLIPKSSMYYMLPLETVLMRSHPEIWRNNIHFTGCSLTKTTLAVSFLFFQTKIKIQNTNRIHFVPTFALW